MIDVIFICIFVGDIIGNMDIINVFLGISYDKILFILEIIYLLNFDIFRYD